MSRWYEVEVQVLIVMAVEVKDDENERHAIEAAEWHAPKRGRVTATAQPLPAGHMETIKKHAHQVIALPGSVHEDSEDDDDD